MDDVVPLVEYKDGRYLPCAETLRWLAGVRKELAITCCVGKYRTGKSFLLNSLSQTSAARGFLVGATVQACTKGLWIMTTPLFEDERTCVLLMDTEGIDSLDAQDDHDVHIFTLGLLLSSVLCYNSVGTIDEASLQTLSLMTNVCKSIRVHADREASPVEISAHMPQFLWILRDFSLKLKRRDGTDCTADEYMEEALTDASSCGEDRSRVRQVIRDAFPRRTILPLPHPTINAKQNLTQGACNDAFRQGVDDLRRRLTETPTFLEAGGARMSGGMYAKAVEHTCEVLNSSGAIPPIKDTWSLLTESQATDLLYRTIEIFRGRAHALARDAIGSDTLASGLRAHVAQSVSEFEASLMEPNAPRSAELARAVEKIVQETLEQRRDATASIVTAKLDAVGASLARDPTPAALLALFSAAIDSFAESTKGDTQDGATFARAALGRVVPWLHLVDAHAREETQRLQAAATNAARDADAHRREAEAELRKLQEAHAFDVGATKALHQQARVTLEEELAHEKERNDANVATIVTLRADLDAKTQEVDELRAAEAPTAEAAPATADDLDMSLVEEQATRIADLESQARELSQELSEHRAIRDTLSTQIDQYKSQIAKQARAHEDDARQAREAAQREIQECSRLRDAAVREHAAIEASMRALTEAHLTLERDHDRERAIHGEERDGHRRELRTLHEEVLAARATLEDSQRRLLELSDAHLVDTRQRDKSARDTIVRLQDKMLEGEISKANAVRQNDKLEAEKNILKRRFEEVAGCEQEVKRLRTNLIETEAKHARMSLEVEKLRSKCDQLVDERERHARTKLA